MPNLKAYREIDEHDVRNGFYSWSGTIPATKGTLVKISSGWSTESELAELGDAGAHWTNTVAQRVGLNTRVAQVTSSGDNVYGMLLYDVRELDENGLPLKWDSAKQARMQCTVSGQSVVLARRGLFLYSGINGGAVPVVGVTPGAPAYAAADGGINVTGSASTTLPATKVGQFAGVPSADGWCLVELDI